MLQTDIRFVVTENKKNYKSYCDNHNYDVKYFLFTNTEVIIGGSYYKYIHIVAIKDLKNKKNCISLSKSS